MKKKITLLLVLFGAALAYVSYLQWREQEVRTATRNDILMITPIGASMDDVLSTIRNMRQWGFMGASFREGYNPRYLEGVHLVRAKNARASVPVDVRGNIWHMRVIWAFDEDGILVDVYAHRMIK